MFEALQSGMPLPNTYFEGEKVQDFEDLLEIENREKADRINELLDEMFK